MMKVHRLLRARSANPTSTLPSIMSSIYERGRFSTLPLRLPPTCLYFTVLPPLVPRLIPSLSVIEKEANVNNEDGHKGHYGLLLDNMLQDVKPSQRLERLRQEHRWLVHRYQQIRRRGVLDVGCENALQTLKQFVIWRGEVVMDRISEMGVQENEPEPVVKARSPSSLWDQARLAVKNR
ncbi:hypothetical protein F4677DRAFT_245277 [Hypoxylon crocopeplum]|nr:hypothetical protein F4677DRAFT_245277 [Hypoxylon crocopeplum]